MDNAPKNSRDTAWATISSAVGALVALRYAHGDPTLAVLYTTLGTAAASAVLVSGWRFLRKFAPWVTEDK